MDSLNELIGKRVNVDMICTQTWQSPRWLKNAIVMQITEHGCVVVYADDDAEHSHGFTGGYLYTDVYNISVL